MTIIMKKLFLIFCFAAYAVFARGSFASVNPTDFDKQKCYIDNPKEKTITFIFDLPTWDISGIEAVEVRGSFNAWESDGRFKMTFDNRNFWFVTLPYTDVRIPGNSGQPEFKFVTNGTDTQDGKRLFVPDGYIFKSTDRNHILVFKEDDLDAIKANSDIANTTKAIEDFDLSSEVGKQAISNFRAVPGTSNLFRSYHPFKVSKPESSTEIERLHRLTELATAAGIKSDICLSGDETGSLTTLSVAGTPYHEAIPPYYQSILDNNSVLYVGASNTIPSYEIAYYQSGSPLLGEWVREIVNFIINDKHQTPFLIHCRLGTDRTGVFCAILAGLCGAEWKDIAADYQLSNNMGTQEFRDYHLLQYSLQKMLGTDNIDGIDNLQASLSDYFTKNGFLTAKEINALKEKLNGGNKK